MVDDNTLLIAIPTYKRSSDIEELLKAIAFVSNYNNVTVTIFDSSTDTQTQRVVCDYNRDVFHNLTYEKMHEEIVSNEKLFLIYQGHSRDYSYIWVLHDHTVFTEEAFEYLIASLNKGYDFLFLQSQGNGYNILQYSDRQLFAEENAWFLGKMGASIVKASTFLEDVNWDYYREKYLTEININFSHVGFFFERLCEGEFSFAEIQFPVSQFFDRHKYGKLSWEKEALKICTECWGSVIMNLPECYTNKKAIINTIDPYFLNSFKLLMGRLQGYYTIADYSKYEKWIQIVFPDLVEDAYNIANLPEDALMQRYVDPFKERIESEIKNGRSIYIYGAGRHGARCLELMEFAQVPPRGFLVSDMEGNPESVRGYGVYELDNVLQDGDPVFAILAVMEKLQIEIEGLLNEEVNKGFDITWMRY